MPRQKILSLKIIVSVGSQHNYNIDVPCMSLSFMKSQVETQTATDNGFEPDPVE